jgi:hypothetical protein
MSNTITNVLPKMLAQGVLALRQAAVTPRLVNRDYEGIAAGLGNVINIPIPSAIAARAVTPSVVMNSNVASAPTVALVTLDHWLESPFESPTTIGSPLRRRSSRCRRAKRSSRSPTTPTCTARQAHGLLRRGRYRRHHAVQRSLTVGGTARKLLNKQLAPVDERSGILDPDAENNFLLNSNRS